MVKEYDFLVFVGRFQPFHLGHKNIIDIALIKADEVIIVVGSSNSARCYHNPFTFDERKGMIEASFPENERKRLHIIPSDDVYNTQLWIKNTQQIVTNVILACINSDTPAIYLHGTASAKIGLIGHSKDSTSYYLKLFPEWGHIDVPQKYIYNATDIRKEYFVTDTYFIKYRNPDYVPSSTQTFLESFMKTEDFLAIVKEYEYIKAYKAAWSVAPHTPIFVTTDAVVVQSGHVLVVRRKSFPGQGLQALPGGFLNPDEYIEDGMIRELREETRIKIPGPVLKGNIKKVKVFDAPYRSSRGRTITHAFLIELPEQTELPKIKKGSDAAAAYWVPLADLRAEDMFEDHFHIVQDMIGGV